MARFAQLTADDATGTALLFNIEHVIAVVPDGFTGTSKIMVSGVTFAVKEDFDTVKSLLTPN